MRGLIALAVALAAPLAADPVCASSIAVVSIYGPKDSGGLMMADGRRLDPKAMTCANRTLRFGTRLYLSRGRNRAEVKITDRGPFVRGRSLDCTEAVNAALHLDGLGRVSVDHWPPLPISKPKEVK